MQLGGGGAIRKIVAPQPGFNLVINFDASVASAPAGFQPAVLGVAALFMKLIITPITVVIDVGYNEVGGGAAGDGSMSGAVGKSQYNNSPSYSWSVVRAAVIANATTPDAKQAASTLPVSDPTGGGAFFFSDAHQRALGLKSGVATQAAPDGYVGFAASGFDYGGGPSVTGIDFCGTVAHEIAEVLGRSMFCGVGGSFFGLDLYRYTAPGAFGNHALQSTASYFSIDAGVTNLRSFNSGAGDAGDWSSAGGANAFNASASANVTQPVDSVDQIVMNAIGWRTNGPITWDTTGL